MQVTNFLTGLEARKEIAEIKQANQARRYGNEDGLTEAQQQVQDMIGELWRTQNDPHCLNSELEKARKNLAIAVRQEREEKADLHRQVEKEWAKS